jgi:hypothetical protein
MNIQNHYTKQQNIFAGGRVVGNVQNGVFYKSIIGSRHILRQPPGIAFSVASIQAAQQAGALRLEIIDTETGTRYTAAMALLLEKGFRLQRGGFEPQIALTLDHWNISKPGDLAGAQLELFEVKQQ